MVAAISLGNAPRKKEPGTDPPPKQPHHECDHHLRVSTGLNLSSRSAGHSRRVQCRRLLRSYRLAPRS